MQVTLTNRKQVELAYELDEACDPRANKFVVAGHKLSTAWGDDQLRLNARGTCACGWVFTEWSSRMADVRDAHQRHLSHVVRQAYRMRNVEVSA